jgi:hypothetical protein
MPPAKVVDFTIEQTIEAVYDFLLVPENFARWAYVGDTAMRHLGVNEWAAETSVGPRILHLATRNAHFDLTHTARPPEGAPHTIPMRLMRNGDGTHVTYVFLRYAGQSDTEWRSAIDWVSADLATLKSYLEGGRRLK